MVRKVVVDVGDCGDRFVVDVCVDVWGVRMGREVVCETRRMGVILDKGEWG